MWMGDVAEFCRKYRVYAIDLIGEPGKSAPNRPEMSGPQHTEWLEDVFEALHVSKVTLLGCSLGSWMALKFATAHPERVEKLVLECPSGVAPAKLSFLFKALPLSLLGEWGRKRVNRLVYGNQPIPEEAEAFGLLIMKHFQPRLNPIPIFSDDELRRLSMPTLLLAGEQDVLLPSAKTSARLRQLLPHLEARVFPEVGHAVLGVTAKIMEFLQADSLSA
jgi:pimeloyl-ACP methyl ester carboxylesterase